MLLTPRSSGCRWTATFCRRSRTLTPTTGTPKNLDELLRRYLITPEARGAALRTKVERARSFDAAIHRFGRKLELKDIEHRDFRTRLYDWRDSDPDHPVAMRQHIKHLSVVLNWAVDRGYMRDNPARGLRHVKSVSRSEVLWSPEAMEAFRAAASPQLRRVFDMARWTGLREGDVLDLRGFQFHDGWLTVTPQKTRRLGVKVYLPYCALLPLGTLVTGLFASRWRDDAHVLRDPQGQPWKPNTFRKVVVRTMRAAGLEGLHFHDLRGTLITQLLEAGCTDAEAGSISGHSIAKGNMRNYAARTRPLAESAYRKLAAHLEARA